MKQILLTLMAAFFLSTSARALSYDEAREQAWFLTDKMAYELNLTEEQYDRIYQINMDYFLNVAAPSDLFGYYWRCRQEDLRYVLFSWQYALYDTLDYFLRPLRWISSRWYYPVFDRYRRGHYYFARPTIYVSYRGGYWRRGPGGISPYRSWRPAPGRTGMRDLHPRRGWADGRNDRRPQQGSTPNRPHTRPGTGNAHPGGYRPGTTSRPNNGTTSRPNGSTTSRPNSSTTSRPNGSTTSRPNSMPRRNTGSRSFQSKKTPTTSGARSSGNTRSSKSSTSRTTRTSSGSGSRTFGR